MGLLYLTNRLLLSSGPAPAACNRPSGPFTGTGIGPSPLASKRKASSVSDAPEGANFDEPTDITVDLPTQVSFYFMLLVDDLSQPVNLLFIKLLGPGLGVPIYGGSLQDVVCNGWPDSVYTPQCYVDPFFCWECPLLLPGPWSTS
jgi:hypothetical protein